MLGVDRILNQINNVISEVSQWFENQGFVPYHFFVVDVIYANFHSKLSDEVCENFKKEFGGEISLNEASYTNDGKISEFEYHCDSSLLEECRNKLRVFLMANDYPYSFFTMGGIHISLYLHEKLSDAQINKFEEEFNLNLKGFSISCNSNSIKYEFTS